MFCPQWYIIWRDETASSKSKGEDFFPTSESAWQVIAYMAQEEVARCRVPSWGRAGDRMRSLGNLSRKYLRSIQSVLIRSSTSLSKIDIPQTYAP